MYNCRITAMYYYITDYTYRIGKCFENVINLIEENLYIRQVIIDLLPYLKYQWMVITINML